MVIIYSQTTYTFLSSQKTYQSYGLIGNQNYYQV